MALVGCRAALAAMDHRCARQAETGLRSAGALTAVGSCGMALAMSDTPPDHLSTNPRSPHFDLEVLQRGIGIRFKGRERKDVEEYSISEGWIRVAAGKSLDRFGNPVTIRLSGEVEAWFEDVAAVDADGPDDGAAA